MLAYYYWARIQENATEYSKAIVNLLKAEEVALSIHDNLYLGYIYRSFSDIYTHTYNSVESLNYARKAYDCFLKTGNHNYIDWGLWDIAKAYHNCTDYDHSLETAREAISLAAAKQDTNLLTDGLRLSGISCIAKQDYPSARKYYSQIRNLGEGLLTADDCRNLGIAYFETGEMDSAKFYMDFLSETDSTQQWLSYQLNKHLGNYRKALYALEKELQYQSTIMYKVIRQNVTQTVSDYRRYEMAAQEKDLAHEKTTKVIILFVLITVILFITIILSLRLKARRKEIESNMLLATNLKQMLQVKDAEHLTMQHTVNQLFEQRFAIIDRLSRSYYEYQGTANEKHKIYTDVMHLVSGLGSDKKTLKELESFVNTYKDNLMQRFREAFPNMAEPDYILYLYAVAGFSSRAISIFIHEKLEVVYNRKSRLKQKINRSSSPEKEYFIQFL